ncbi:hypothetical protein [Jannaschia pohangensis]|uniref:hypothetical protein n=1 Tax=Jannaschia pohangensis TaxID=390807 RepID=UPI000B8256F2|nr:hypothetical protein [Jannaschia pohangensis]
MPKLERDVVIAFRQGPTAVDTAQRAQASAGVVDAAFFALGEDIRARLERASQTGSEFRARDLIRVSQATGLTLARTIDKEHGCFLID